MNKLIRNIFKEHLNKQIFYRSASFRDIFKGKNDQIDLKNSPIEKEETIISSESNLESNQAQDLKLARFKAYKPANDVEVKIKLFVKQVFEDDISKQSLNEITLSDPINKFKLLTKCIEQFKHNISNTTLNDIKTVEDLVTYYLTEQKDTSTLEDLKQMPDLPPNLHINLEYNRFDPTTDTFFNGKDAYPKRDSIVTSLWYSKKYKSIIKKKDYFSK